MMTEFDNRNRFTLFRNNRKREGKNDPDWTGTYTDAEGQEHWLSGWITESKKTGEKFLSGPVKPKDAKGDTPPPRKKSVELNDEVPF